MPTANEIKAELIRRELQSRNVSPVQSNIEQAPLSEAAQQGENWATAGGNVLGGKSTPGFMDNVALIEAATAKGTLEFTGRVASAFEQVLRGGGQPEFTQNAIQHWSDKKKELTDKFGYSGLTKIMADTGEIGAELITTAPLSAGFKAVSALSKLVPRGLQTATAAGGGGALLSGLAGLQVKPGDPRNFSPEQAIEAASSPWTYAIPGATHAIGNYLDRARKYGQVEEMFGSATIPRNTRYTTEIDKVTGKEMYHSGPVKRMLHLMYDSLPMLSHAGKAVNQFEHIGPAIGNVIRKIAHSPLALSSAEYGTYVAKKIQSGYKKLQKQEDELWEAGFKENTIADPDAVNNIASEAKKILLTSGIPTSKASKTFIEEEISKVQPAHTKVTKGNIVDAQGNTIDKIEEIAQKGKYTVKDVRRIQQIIGNAASDAYAIEGGTGVEIGKRLSKLKDDLFDNIQASLGPTELAAFIKAKKYSQGIFSLQDNLHNLVDAAVDESMALKVADSFIKDSRKFEAAKQGGLISKSAQQATKAREIAEALESASDIGGVNINKFIKRINPDYGKSTAQKILSASELDYVKGLSNYMRSMAEAKKVGATGRLLAVGTGIGVGAGIGAGAANVSGNDDWMTEAAIITYPAMLFAANHPVLKRILGLSTRNLSNSAAKHVNEKIQDLMSRAGYFMTEDGKLDITKDKK